MNSDDIEILQAFEDNRLDPGSFRHRDHIKVACAMLNRYEFIDALYRYTLSIRALAAKAGAGDKFNATVTFAFLSVIAERMAISGYRDYDSFVENNPDLLSKTLLAQWYSPRRLQSALARRIALLPDKENI